MNKVDHEKLRKAFEEFRNGLQRHLYLKGMTVEVTEIRLVPVLSGLSEQARPVAPTPKYKLSWPYQLGEWLMGFRMSDSQEVVLTIAAVDKRQNPVQLPAGSIAWEVDNPNLLALTPSEDGMSCKVSAVGPLGAGVVSVKVLDKNGTGNLAAGSFGVEIDAGKVTTINIVAGEPSEETPPSPPPPPPPPEVPSTVPPTPEPTPTPQEPHTTFVPEESSDTLPEVKRPVKK